MHKVLYLAKVLKKGTGSGSDSMATRTMMTILGIALAALLAVLGVFMKNFAAVTGDPVVLFQSFFMIGAVMALVFAIPLILNTMYMSNDLPVLLTMPYSYNEIIWAKVLNVSSIVWEVCAVFSLPCQVAYGIANGASVSFYLAVVLAAICVPVIVLSFIGSVMVLIMSFVHTMRNKDTLKILGAVLGFGALVAFILLTNFSKADKSALTGALATLGNFVNVIPVNFALRVLLEGSLDPLMLLAIVGITAAFFLVFVVLVKFLYINGALAMQDTSSSAKHLDAAAMEENCRQQSVFRAYLRKELRLVRRNPAYLTNGFLITILYPAVILVLYMFSSNSLEILSLSKLHSDMDFLSWATGMAIMIPSLACASNTIANSCMSREGEDLMILKQTPVDYSEVLKAKQWAALMVCGGSSCGYVVIGGLILCFLGILPIWTVPYALVLNLAIMVFSVNKLMMTDLKKPSFTWESEADMLKTRGTGTGIFLAIGGIFSALALIIVLRLLPAFCFWPVLVVVLLLSVLVIRASNRRLFRVGVAIMKKY